MLRDDHRSDDLLLRAFCTKSCWAECNLFEGFVQQDSFEQRVEEIRPGLIDVIEGALLIFKGYLVPHFSVSFKETETHLGTRWNAKFAIQSERIMSMYCVFAIVWTQCKTALARLMGR